MKLKKVLKICALWCACAVAFAQSELPQATARLQPERGKIGDEFALVAELSYDAVTTVPPQIKVNQLSSREDNKTTWTLLEQPAVQKETANGVTKETHTYRVSAYTLGALAAPPVVLTQVRDGKSTTTALSVNPIEIVTTLSLDDKFLPLKSPVDVPFPGWFTWLPRVVIALFVAAALWWLWRRYHRKIRDVISPPVTPDAWALREIRKLEDEHLIESRQFKTLYTRLTETLRLYTARITGVPAMDLTSDELLHELEQHENFSKETETLLATTLHEADLVKFAKYTPESRLCNKTLERAKLFIQTSKPADIATP